MPVQRLRLSNPKTILFCLGCLSALAMAPVYAWPIMAVGYSALVYSLLKTTSWKQAGAYAFVFFLGYFLTGLYWVSSSLFVEIDLWWWALPFSFFGLPILLALFPTIIIAVFSIIPKLRFVAFVIAIILADISRGSLITGFPWNMPVHTWVNTDVMMTTLPYIGLYGLNAITILLFCIPALLNNISRAIYLMILIAISIVPITKTDINNIPDNIVMIQANIPQNEKWGADYLWRNFNRYIDMSQDAIMDKTAPQIIIWPETAMSQYFLSYEEPQTIFETFLRDLPDESILITGLLNHAGDENYNSIAVFNRQGDIIAQYDKHHLVPFGEYMPFGLDTITGFNNFSAGPKPELIRLDDQNINFLPLICYESIFSTYVNNSTYGGLLLVLTNDSWFGKTAGPYQHFDHARFRSIEANQPALRLSGNGISAIIDNHGQIKQISKLNHQAIIFSK